MSSTEDSLTDQYFELLIHWYIAQIKIEILEQELASLWSRSFWHDDELSHTASDHPPMDIVELEVQINVLGDHVDDLRGLHYDQRQTERPWDELEQEEGLLEGGSGEESDEASEDELEQEEGYYS